MSLYDDIDLDNKSGDAKSDICKYTYILNAMNICKFVGLEI